MSSAALFASLIPVIIVIGIGFGSRASGVVTEAHTAGVERVTYILLFPALLVSNIASAPIVGGEVWQLAAVMATTQIVIAGLSWLVFTRLAGNGPKATSAFQGGVRFNTYIALALVFALFGAPGVQLVAIPLGLVIIIVNVFCVAILIRYGQPDGLGAETSYWRQLASNPLIIACAIGLVLNPFIDGWPPALQTVFDWFSGAAIGLGLFAVGAGLKPVAAGGSWALIVQANAMGLIAKPALFVAFGWVLGLDAQILAIGLVCMAVPTATSAYILARQMGGDAPLMAQIVSVGTLASGLTLLGWLALVSALS